MNKRLWFIGGGLILLAALLVGVGFLLPSQASVTRTMAMKGPATYIHANLRDPQLVQEWLTFGVQRPETQVRFEGAERDEGAVLIWSRPGAAERRFAVTGGEPGAFVFHEADLGYRYPTKGRFEIVTEGNRRRVAWTLTFDFGNNLIGRYTGLVMGLVVGERMQRSLLNLKNEIEAPSSPFPEPGAN